MRKELLTVLYELFVKLAELFGHAAQGAVAETARPIGADTVTAAVLHAQDVALYQVLDLAGGVLHVYTQHMPYVR